MVNQVFIGTSGYSYDHWANGVFYHPRLPKTKWLEYYTKYFDTVELNGTFCRLPQEKAFVTWDENTEDSFRFAVKGSRVITHIKRLAELGDSVSVFGKRIDLLKDKCAVVLWQLPPKMKADIDRLEQSCVQTEGIIHRRQAFEFRNESWFTKEVYEVLHRFGCSLCLADGPSEVTGPITADYVYVRRHGPTGLYEGCFSASDFKKDASQIKKWLGERKDVYIYFNNDVGGYAV
jgi:uncharacterized protein YecE (DUF72 family)